MSEANPRWVDAPDFNWRPEQPFGVDPQFADTSPFVSRCADSFAPARPANTTPTYLLARLLVGGLQGLGLVLLSAGHGASMSASAETMVLLFAPMLLLAGFGRVPGKLLLPWTFIAGIALAALGAYQYWYLPGPISAAAIAMAAIALFIGQALVTAWAKDAKPRASYPAYHDSAWSLAIQTLLCALCASFAALVVGAADNLLHAHFFPIALLVALAVALASWFLSPPILRVLMRGLLAVLSLALPIWTLIAAAVMIAALLRLWLPPLLLDIALAGGLLLGINACGGEERPRWHQNVTLAACAVMAPLLVLGALALQARVAQWGWTSPRIFASVCLSVLALYATAYGGSALISLRGGSWMRQIERINLAMAAVILALLAGLASPLADPLRLSVQNQIHRWEIGRVVPEKFDWAYLKNSGRFGHDALAQMAARKSAPVPQQGVTLSLPRISGSAHPAKIGANIHVRGSDDRVPASLLARDWSTVPGAPSCLATVAVSCDAYFIDLDRDGRDEIMLVQGTNAAWQATVMKKAPATPENRSGWYPAGTLASSCPGSLAALRAGRFASVAPRPSGWRDLMVDGARLVVATHHAQSACAR